MRIVTKIKKESRGSNFVYTKNRIHDISANNGSCNLRKIEDRKCYAKEEINEMINRKILRVSKCDHCLAWEDVEFEETD